MLEHPITVEGEPEMLRVHSRSLHKIDRAAYAIAAICRMVGNSAGEPDATHNQPLDAFVIVSLMGGAEILAEYILDLTDDERGSPAMMVQGGAA